MGKPLIYFRPVRPLEGTIATFDVLLLGVRSWDAIVLELHEIKFEGDNAKDDKKLGTIKGPAVSTATHMFTVYPEEGGVEGAIDPSKDTQDDKAKKKPRVALNLPKLDGGAHILYFDVPVDPIDGKDRETWFFQVKMTAPKEVKSTKYPVAVVPWMLPVGEKATYDWHAHNEVHFYHHGGDGPPGSGGALADIAEAIKGAENFVFVADWSFHPYFRVVRGTDSVDDTAGRRLAEKAKGVLVAIHAWHHASQVADEQNNYMGERLEELAGGQLPEQLHWRTSARTGQRWSHHQKLVIVDIKGPDGRREVKAFFGGLDLTRGRFDWDDHVISPKDGQAGEFRKAVKRNGTLKDFEKIKEYHDWYNGEFVDSGPMGEESGGAGDLDAPREPWHDIHGWVTGPAAWDLMREFVGRWNNDPSGDGHGTGWDESWVDGGPDSPSVQMHTFIPSDVDAINTKFKSLFDNKKFVQQNEQPKGIADRPWCAQVYRSLEKQHWDKSKALNGPVKINGRTEFEWKLGSGFERSIQDAYLNAIGRAEDFIYIETQYFISSGHEWSDSRSGVANTLAKAICDRIVQKKGEKFHCYIVTPMYPEGAPDAGSVQSVRYLEWQTIDYMLGRLTKELGQHKWREFLSFYFPGRAMGGPKFGKVVSARHANYRVHAGKVGGKETRLYVDERNKPPMPKWDSKYLGLASTESVEAPNRKELVEANNRYYIYVHSKMMIVDDEWIIFGSANLNERSLAGDRDSEICVGMWPAYPSVKEKCKAQIKKFRTDLWKEHFGSAGGADPKAGSNDLRIAGASNYEAYRNGVPLPSGHAMMLPLYYDEGTTKVGSMDVAEWSNEYLPDAPTHDKVWRWMSDWTKTFDTRFSVYLAEITE